MIKKLLPAFGLLLIVGTPFQISAQSEARYTITFTSVWNDTDHGPLPGTAHWSDLVGATHNSSVTFWEEGQTASLGIENVAEQGVNTFFNTEVNTAISNSTADQWLQVSFIPFAAISTATLSNVVVSSDYPLLTLASMVAPSPDWFVGVNGYSLLDGGGSWKNNVVLDMFVYDAGTEDGSAYSTSNPATVPAVPIFSRTNITPFNDQKIGTLSITLDEVLNLEDADWRYEISITPNPAKNCIRIHNPAREKIEFIQLYDLVGNKLIDLKPNDYSPTQEVDLTSLSSGMYLLILSSDNEQVLTKKIILD